MKKSIRNILILVLVLAVLGGAAFALTLLPRGDDGESPASSAVEEAPSALFGRSSDEVETVKVENDEGDFELRATDTGFVLSGYEEGYDLSASALSTAARCLFSAETARELGAQGDLAAFGLSGEGSVRVTVTYEDGAKDEAVLGAEAAETAGRYVLKDGKVYILSGISQTLYGGIGGLFNTSLYSIGTRELDPDEEASADGTVSDRLYELTLSGTNFPNPIHIEYNADTFGYYAITEPITAESGNQALTDLITSLKTLVVAGVEAIDPTEEELEELGLAEPYAKAEFNVNGEEHTIAVSAAHSGNRSLMLDDRSVVYTVGQSVVSEWADAKLGDLRMTYVFLANIEEVKELTIVLDGDEAHGFSIERTVDEENTTDTHTDYDLSVTAASGKALNYEDYQHFYGRVLGMAMLSSDPVEYNDKTPPVFSVTYSYFGGGEDTVEYYEAGKDRYAAVFNGGYNGVVRASELKAVVDYLPVLESGGTVPSKF